MKITREILEAAGAGEEEVARFTELYGASIDVTEAWCREHPKSVLRYNDWDWAGRHLLPLPLRLEFERQQSLLRSDYLRRTEPLCIGHPKINGQWGGLHLLSVTQKAEYERLHAPLWDDYQLRKAALFGRLAEQVGG